MKNEFTKDERYYFMRMVDYFINAQKREIHELSSPGGNPAFLPKEELMLEIFESIKVKVIEAFFGEKGE
jgi:hypothetical protein